MRPSVTGGLVYSTDGGRMCPACRHPLTDCVCGTQVNERPRGDGVVRVSREAKGRHGKTVTVVRGLDLEDTALAATGKRLRAACGAGGTLKDGVLELQGDHCDRVIAFLTKEGWKVKRAGG